MKPYYEKDGIVIFLGDCLSAMAEMPANSVDLILTDPPYFKVKNEAWDRQWETPDGFIVWIGQLCAEWQRILKPNGSLYVFASPQMSARVEIEIGRWFNILNRITWRKPPFSTKAEMFRKEDLRGFFPASESIVFAEHFGADNIAKGEAGYTAKCDELRGFVFEPLRAYLDGERKRAGIDKADCNAACGFTRTAGGMASRHYFSRSQWCLPTAEHYEAMRSLFNESGGDYLPKPHGELRREYEFLTREYEDLRREYEDLRRPFSVTPKVPYTDVWDFKTVQDYPGKHPCEKPAAMLRHIVNASSRPGAVVLDCFMGTGSTAVVCKQTGREFVGMDTGEAYLEIAAKRLAQGILL